MRTILRRIAAIVRHHALLRDKAMALRRANAINAENAMTVTAAGHQGRMLTKGAVMGTKLLWGIEPSGAVDIKLARKFMQQRFIDPHTTAYVKFAKAV